MSNREKSEELNINAIVKKLMDEGTRELTYGVINNLRKMFAHEDNKENIITAIIETFEDRHKSINKIATKFIDMFQKKYAPIFSTMTMSKFIRTTLKYKKKYKITDAQFDAIKAIFEQRIYELNPVKSNKIYPHTNMSNIFGYPSINDKYENPFDINNPEDFAYLQEILKTYKNYLF